MLIRKSIKIEIQTRAKFFLENNTVRSSTATGLNCDYPLDLVVESSRRIISSALGMTILHQILLTLIGL